MRKRLVLSVAFLALLTSCKDETSTDAKAARIIGEDGRYDCGDSSLTLEESKQWDWLRRGFRMTGKGRSFPSGEFQVSFVRREPKGVELLLQLERSNGHDRALLVRPRTPLFQEFTTASMEKGLAVASLWDPQTPLDTLLLPDSLAKAGMALVEAKDLGAWTSMRRCDTATQAPAPLMEAIYFIQVTASNLQLVHALRPGFYADPFWNSLQKYIDQRETLPAGVGF